MPNYVYIPISVDIYQKSIDLWLNLTKTHVLLKFGLVLQNFGNMQHTQYTKHNDYTGNMHKTAALNSYYHMCLCVCVSV